MKLNLLGRPRLWLWILPLLAVLGVAAWYFSRQSESAPTYRFAKVEKGPITATVSSTGTLNPVTSVQVGTQVSGQIKELFVDFNSPVKKGELIARIDPETFRTACGRPRRTSSRRAPRSTGRRCRWPIRSATWHAPRNWWRASSCRRRNSIARSRRTTWPPRRSVPRRRSCSSARRSLPPPGSTSRAPRSARRSTASSSSAASMSGRPSQRACRRRNSSSSPRICATCRSRPRSTRPMSGASVRASA